MFHNLSDGWGSQIWAVCCAVVRLLTAHPQPAQHRLLFQVKLIYPAYVRTPDNLRIRTVYKHLNQQGNSANKTQNLQGAHTQNAHERKKSTAKFPPRDSVQQRILQAWGHSTGAITSQTLPTLGAVPGKLLVLSRAQHPLQLQDKLDHRHSALMRWKPRDKKTTHQAS